MQSRDRSRPKILPPLTPRRWRAGRGQSVPGFVTCGGPWGKRWKLLPRLILPLGGPRSHFACGNRSEQGLDPDAPSRAPLDLLGRLSFEGGRHPRPWAPASRGRLPGGPPVAGGPGRGCRLQPWAGVKAAWLWAEQGGPAPGSEHCPDAGRTYRTWALPRRRSRRPSRRRPAVRALPLQPLRLSFRWFRPTPRTIGLSADACPSNVVETSSHCLG